MRMSFGLHRNGSGGYGCDEGGESELVAVVFAAVIVAELETTSAPIVFPAGAACTVTVAPD